MNGSTKTFWHTDGSAYDIRVDYARPTGALDINELLRYCVANDCIDQLIRFWEIEEISTFPLRGGRKMRAAF